MNGSDSHFDAIVVGSGFGGSVMTYRLAEAGMRVCLLERGHPYPPGSFPRTPYEMRHNFWDPSEGHYGLFNVWSFRGIAALISSGLGGGSLIYANVLLRKDEDWFVDDLATGGYEHWPVKRRELEPHYDRVERMLQPVPYPMDHEPYGRTMKTLEFKKACEALAGQWRYRRDVRWMLPPLAVAFGNEGDPPQPGIPLQEAHANIHGRPRQTCRLCAECDVGCNYGSKNTLDYTYLSAAVRQPVPADIRTLCEVRSIAPADGGGFTVTYVDHQTNAGPIGRPGRSSRASPPAERRLTCNQLILSAGALGSPFLLMRDAARLPGLSRALGSRFCGNGDLLTFAIRARKKDGGRRQPRVLEASRGTVITSAFRMRDKAEGGRTRGYYVEDAGYPDFISWLVQAADAPGSLRRYVQLGVRYLKSLAGRHAGADFGSEFAAAFGATHLASGSLPMLGMGRDIPNGQMSLQDGRYLDLDWKLRESRPFFAHMRRTMKDLSRALDARFRDNLIWYLGRVVTVHPLGGCPMGASPERGVVDDGGEVFGHPGLYIADGSVLPGPVGANPALTIAAFADRFADRVIANRRRLER